MIRFVAGIGLILFGSYALATGLSIIIVVLAFLIGAGLLMGEDTGEYARFTEGRVERLSPKRHGFVVVDDKGEEWRSREGWPSRDQARLAMYNFCKDMRHRERIVPVLVRVNQREEAAED